MLTRVRIFCWILLAVVLPIGCAPRSKHSNTPQTVYDQKQTGDYNIQLHLKDFQIIALLGDDTLGSLGDYDYNYDYSDFTVKPGSSKPTSEPTSTPSRPLPSSTPIQQIPSSTLTPTGHPYPILTPSTIQPPKGNPPNLQEKPINSTEQSSQFASAANEVDKTEKPTSANGETVALVSSTTRRTDNVEELNSPGKIKVQILETPGNSVPGEEVHSPIAATPGEIVQLRRCALGFSRDKNGRCRRVRRPPKGGSQLPYGFGRLASNLVSRFRNVSPDTASTSYSESTED